MQDMAPPDSGSEGREVFESYTREEEQYATNAPPATPSEYRRKPSPETNNNSSSSSRPVGYYREDYSRAQHASLGEQQQQQQQPYSSSIHRASSDVGPTTASPEHLRFSAYVNRFASHDPRTAPVHNSNNHYHHHQSVSVSERIAKFNGNSSSNSNNAQSLLPSSSQPKQKYRTTPHPGSKRRSDTEASFRPHPSQQQQQQKPSSSSSNRRHQQLAHAQERYRSRSAEPRQSHHSHQQQQHHSTLIATETTPSRSHSREKQQLAAATTTLTSTSSRHRVTSSSSSRERSLSRERKSQQQSSAPVTQREGSGNSDSHRAARSLLAKRRQRRLDQESKQQQQHHHEEANRQMNGHAVQKNQETTRENRVRVKEERATSSSVAVTANRDEGRADRILREARSRSMSPRTSRYTRRKVSISTTNTSQTLMNETPERPALAMDYHHACQTSSSSSSPLENQWSATGRRSSSGGSSSMDYRTSTPEKLIRAVNTQTAASIAVRREQEPVSPMTPGSASSRSPKARLLNDSGNSGNSVITSGSNTTSSTVQDLKRQLWDNNETLQVSVKPSLAAHGYSDRSTKQTTGYYAPEMAGHEGQRVRSLSPNPRRDIHGHERPAGSTVGAPGGGVVTYSNSGSSMFNSKFYQAALASHKENPMPQQPSAAATETPQNAVSSSSPSNYQVITTTYRRLQEDRPQHRAESPRPPIIPTRGEPWRSSPEEMNDSPHRGLSPVESATHSIERVPSSAGVSTATGEASVAKLVARLSSVSRDDPEKALQVIDSILRAESMSSAGKPSSRASSRSGVRSPALATQNETTTTEDDDDDDDESDSSETSCDDSSVSSITNPTYQRDDKHTTQVHVASTSNMRNPRPSALNKYAQQKVSPRSQDESRGKSSKARKEKKPPPPATINVNSKNGSGGSSAEKRSSNTKKEKKNAGSSSFRKSPEPLPSAKDAKLNPYAKLQPENNEPMDAAAIAMKIRGWDEQLNSRQTPPNAPIPLEPCALSPTQTEDTARTEDLGSLLTSDSHNKQTVRTDELGSIVTSQSQNRRTESADSRRAHPWDDHRPQNDKSPMAIDLTIGAGTTNGFVNAENDASFTPTSPWRRRRAAKQESEGADVVPPMRTTSTDWENGGVGSAAQARERLNRRRRSKSPAKAPTIAPNVYDVHRDRRSRSKERHHEIHPKPAIRTSSGEGHREASHERRPTSTKSDSVNPFDSAWTELPPDAFPSQPTTPGRKLPDAVASAFSNDANLLESLGPQQMMPSVELPPRTPSSRAPFGNKEELQEASRDPADHQGGSNRFRRSLMKFKRSNTPKTDRPLPQPKNTKPLLSAYAMDSLDVDEQFQVGGRGRDNISVSPSLLLQHGGVGHFLQLHEAQWADRKAGPCRWQVRMKHSP